MKLAEHSNKLETNAKTVSQNFGIGDASVVIEILRNRLYEHKVRTLVQEYICNGRDAMREIGSKDKLIVSVPNELSPVFKVRDFGPGITPERMSKVFVLYGASTKRDSNNQTGGFGIGAKSAWSYTDSFNIVTFVDGIKRTYVAHTGHNNQGSLDLLSETHTKEKNGTEIQIAIKPHDARQFRDAIYRAVYFWNESEMPQFRGVTDLDLPGKPQTTKISESLEICVNKFPDFTEISSGYYGGLSLVIDGVIYPMPDRLVDQVKSLEALRNRVKTHAIIRLPTGLVQVGASREKVDDSDVTRAALNKIATKANSEIIQFIKDRFDAAKTNKEWIATYKEVTKVLDVKGHATHGQYRIDSGMLCSELFRKVSMVKTEKYVSRRYRYRNSGGATGKYKVDEANSLPLDHEGALFYDDTNDSPIVRSKRIKDYLATVNHSCVVLFKAKETTSMVFKKDKDGNATTEIEKTVVLTSMKESEKVLKQLTSDLNIMPISSLPYVPTPRQKKEKVERTKAHFAIHKIYNDGNKGPKSLTLQTVMDESTTYAWIALEDYEKYKEDFGNLANWLEDNENVVLCALAEKSRKMIEGCDKFVEYEKWLKEFTPKATLLKQIASQETGHHKIVYALRKADLKVKDKLVSKLLETYPKEPKKEDNVRVPSLIVKACKDHVKEILEDDAAFAKSLEDSYPLIKAYIDEYTYYNCNKKIANELIEYINAKHG